MQRCIVIVLVRNMLILEGIPMYILALPAVDCYAVRTAVPDSTSIGPQNVYSTVTSALHHMCIFIDAFTSRLAQTTSDAK